MQKKVEARRKKIPISGRKPARQPQTVNKSVKREWMLVGGRNPTKKPAGRKESFPRDSRITSGLSRSKTSLSRPFRAFASGPIRAPSTGNRASWRVPLLFRASLRLLPFEKKLCVNECLNRSARKNMINSDNIKFEENFLPTKALRFLKISQ